MKVRLDIPLTVSEILEATGGEYHGKDGVIRFISTDSREVDADTLFIAFGKGEDFVPDALCCGYVLSSKNDDAILVKDTQKAFLEVATYYKKRLTKLKKTVMITGSVGKTTVKDFTAKILEAKYKVHKSNDNFNNHIGLPLSILSADKDTEILVLEAGMNHVGEIENLSLTARPNIAIITCIGTAHIGNLGSRENIAKAKLEILKGLSDDGVLIVPEDEPLLRGYKNELLFGYGADAEYKIISSNAKETVFNLRVFDKTVKDIRVPFVGEHLVKDVCIAALVGAYLGLDAREIKDGISKISGVNSRQNIINLKNFTVCDDSYNASFESYIADFEVLKSYDGETAAVIGDMLELGDKAEVLHFNIGVLAAKYGINRLYPFGHFASVVAKGALSAGFKCDAVFANTDPLCHKETARAIIENTVPGSLVLIKGSRALQTEKITAYLKAEIGEKNDE